MLQTDDGCVVKSARMMSGDWGTALSIALIGDNNRHLLAELV
jgi:hypothetical protein